MSSTSIIHRTQTFAPDPDEAVEALLDGAPSASGLHVVFAASPYDLERLGPQLKDRFKGTVVGCTTSGHFGPKGFEKTGATAFSIYGPRTKSWTWVIDNLLHPDAQIDKIRQEVLATTDSLDPSKTFGILLAAVQTPSGFDWEQRLAMPALQILRASDRDEGSILFDGRFRRNIATFTLVTTDLACSVFTLPRHRATSIRLAITDADWQTKRVFEINGMTAAEAYAEALQIAVGDLSPAVYARHPLMITGYKSGFIRTPLMVYADGSMQFDQGLQPGIVVRLGTLREENSGLRQDLDELSTRVGGTQGIMTLDCHHAGLDDPTSEIFIENKVVGCSLAKQGFHASQRGHAIVGVAFGPV